jgi:class 3 adenylate cyclase
VWSRAAGTAKFCSECGAPITAATKPAEYKQVTVLFADVVHSMEMAVGAERLREMMTELVNRSVRRSRWRITLFAHAWPRWKSNG